MSHCTCPACRSSRLAWDARSRAFLCLSRECSAAFQPVMAGVEDLTVSTLISRGQMQIDTTLFEEALAQAVKVKLERTRLYRVEIRVVVHHEASHA